MKWTLLPASQFEEHAARWDALHAQCRASPLLSRAFVQPLLAELAPQPSWLAICEERGATIAIALLTKSSSVSWATLQPPQAPLGLWLQDGDRDPSALLAALMPALPGVALVLGLTQCDPALMARPPDSARLRTADYIDTACITLAGGFDAFWNARGKNLRANLKKQRARLAREGVAVRLEACRDAGQVAAAIEQYGRLESAGWKAGGGTAVTAANAQGRYYRAMLEAFCARGQGCIYRYWFGAQLVAMDLCIEDAHQIIVLKTAYDESVASGLSPTLLMREEACRALFDEGRLGKLEFYGRVMEWHTRWTDEVRTLYHVNFYRTAPLARLHAWWRRRRASS
jgi:CelD/BcsL family acetyltransferase involved in cellulose biosynthesis